MRQVFDVTVASCIPNIKFDLVFLPAVVHLDGTAEVGHHVRPIGAALLSAFHKCVDYTRLADGAIAHENYFGLFGCHRRNGHTLGVVRPILG